MSGRFAGKIALVTGAASGIGRACMNRLSADGATVVGLDYNMELLTRAVAQAPSPAFAMHCNVMEQDAIERTIAQIVAQHHAIDILVNNAGIGNPAHVKLHEQPVDDWDRVIAVNVRGVFLMMRAVIPQMLAQGAGAIVNMASIGSFRAAAGASPYITSKGAVLMMTRTAAVDYARDNIRINAVCPGTTNTEILAGQPPEMIERLVSRSPQGELVEPEEVAALVAFLASGETPHLTGGSYLIDAGRSAW